MCLLLRASPMMLGVVVLAVVVMVCGASAAASSPAHTSLSMLSEKPGTWDKLGGAAFKAIDVINEKQGGDAIEMEYTTVDRCKPPQFDPPEGKYVRSVDVTLTSATKEATIYYTTNLVTPTKEESLHADSNSPITIDTPGVVTLRAMAVKDGITDSSVSEAKYHIQTQVAPLLFCSVVGFSCLFDAKRMAWLDGATTDITREGHIYGISDVVLGM